ncbi:MAG: glycosyltransferase family 4 protein [Lachnospiraceae bacterium]|nr:glycosyltransferase family 4 protein [Lachnospiraceae bacterium]
MNEKNKKKILYLMEYPIDLPGGGQMSTQTLCDGIVDVFSGKNMTENKGEKYKYQYEPVVCCPTLLKKTASDYDFRIVTYKSDENREDTKLKRIFNFLSRIGSFRKIIKSENPDLIHVSMSESLITFGFLRCLGLFSKIPFVYTDRGLAYGYRKHSMTCIKATLKHASRLLTTTQFNKDLWSKENLSCDITVIPNTISTSFNDYDENRRQEMRKKYGIKDDELVVGFAGRISEEKDWPFVPVLVDALSKTKVKFKVALVISIYEAGDINQVNEIKSGIIDAIGEDNLIYLQDLSQKEMADYYYLVDTFVMSSMFESFGKAAVEAMSRKCSVLSTTAGGLREVIGKEENLYTKDSVSKFTDRIKTLYERPDELNADREFFYNRYKNNYTIDSNVSRHLALYEEILVAKR